MSQPAIGLAPLMSYTDFPSRVWFHVVSRPAFVGAPFLRITRADNEIRVPRRYVPEFEELRGGMPYELVPQVMASSAERFVEAAEILLRVAPVVDLNCGCPSPTVTGRGGGSSLLEDPDEFARLLDHVASAVGARRVSVKTRVGVESTEFFDDIVAALSRHAWSRVIVHGRSRREGYTGVARWELVERAARVCRAAVWGSGDVAGVATWERARGIAPSASGVVVGRGALRNPWVFEELRRGELVRVPIECVWSAMALFGLLHQMGRHDIDRLVAWADKVGLRGTAGDDVDAWRRIVESAGAAQGLRFARLEDVDLDRQGVGGVKSLWHYVRSSLPRVYWGLALMRAKTFADFVEAGRRLARDEGITEVLLTHHGELDPLFAYERGARSLMEALANRLSTEVTS